MKQGYKDSNLEMTESESVALPFGDSPMNDLLDVLYMNVSYFATPNFKNFLRVNAKPKNEEAGGCRDATKRVPQSQRHAAATRTV